MTKSNDKTTNIQKWQISIFAGILFLIIAAPFTFKLVNALTSKLHLTICDGNGRPNTYGLILHTIVFILAIRLSMLLEV